MLEFIPESREALAELVSMEDPELDESLIAMGQRARQIVPELIGLSLTVVDEGVTFTLVAPNSGVAALDAMQYIDSGPCVEVLATPGELIGTTIADLLDEDRWTLFARGSAAAGVASTLSMATVDALGNVAGGINLYASAPQAFQGLHQELAEALGASALSMVTNADLGFRSREEARRAPARLRDRAQEDAAIGLLASRYNQDLEAARSRLMDAAERAGVSAAVVARVLLITRE